MEHSATHPTPEEHHVRAWFRNPFNNIRFRPPADCDASLFDPQARSQTAHRLSLSLQDLLSPCHDGSHPARPPSLHSRLAFSPPSNVTSAVPWAIRNDRNVRSHFKPRLHRLKSSDRIPASRFTHKNLHFVSSILKSRLRYQYRAHRPRSPAHAMASRSFVHDV